FILLSYFAIIYYVKLSSNEDKKKMGSTCLSHLIVVVCYYGPLFVRIVLTRMGVVLTVEERHNITIGAILGPSLVNPFVYCLRTKEMKYGVLRLISRSQAVGWRTEEMRRRSEGKDAAAVALTLKSAREI
ncbi:olfactory receptor 1030-like, partial [Stegastes partitus]|uniref:Olfactory receptor 1030-like n=1 Tax=Stegastes partitus TaxID=144197 RepID=A0A9Y4JIP2_9TELE